MTRMTLTTNRPTGQKAGVMASTTNTFSIISTTTFGPFSRYCVKECRTRFGTTTWMVSDAEIVDEVCDLPAIIRQFDTVEELDAFKASVVEAG